MHIGTLETKELNKMAGIADLPMSVRGPFILALKAEANGDAAGADARLAQAIAAEQSANAK